MYIPYLIINKVYLALNLDGFLKKSIHPTRYYYKKKGKKKCPIQIKLNQPC